MCSTFDFMPIISMAFAHLKFSCFWLIELSPFSGHTYFRMEMMSSSCITAICSELSLSPRPTSHWETCATSVYLLWTLICACVWSRWTPIETKVLLWIFNPNEWTINVLLSCQLPGTHIEFCVTFWNRRSCGFPVLQPSITGVSNSYYSYCTLQKITSYQLWTFVDDMYQSSSDNDFKMERVTGLLYRQIKMLFICHYGLL